MKIAVIYFTILFLSISNLVITDIISGMNFSTAIGVLVQTFSVTLPGESWLVIGALAVPILTPFTSIVWNRMKQIKNRER